MSYIGLDVGTTGCKAVAFDSNGQQLSSAYREYPVISPQDGWAELDSAQVCRGCLEVIRETAAHCSGDPVRGIGISSQGEAFTPVGPDGEFLGNAMVSSDIRAASIADTWSREFGREKLYEITGHTAHPMFTVFKLLWVREHQPDVWRRAKTFHCFEDLIHTQLGVEPAMSWPLAGRTMMFDVRKHDWDESILDAVGLERSRLPRTLPSGAIVGVVPSTVCRDLQLADGAIVVAGGHDQPCGALGAGVTEPGVAVYGTGTVECITPAFPHPVFSSELFANNLCTYDFTIPGMYTTVAFSLTGGNLLKWFRDEFGQPELEEARRTGKNAYTLLIEHMAGEPTSLMVLPYFTPSGTPYFDTRTRGAILGLRLTSTRGQILRALLEGVAFEMRLNLNILDKSGVPVKELMAIG
ncbi:MAG: FGGY-family carbohydrate kinase, partial [Armatimonadota bacterium]